MDWGSAGALGDSSFKMVDLIRSGDFISKDELCEEYRIPVIGGNGVMGYTDKNNIDKSTIAIGRVGALCGNIHYIDSKSWITDNTLFIPDWQKDKINLKYLQRVLEKNNLNSLASQTAQPLITGELVKKQAIPLPNIEDQTQIVDFLDQKISEIDALNNEIRLQIQKLKEYRQSLISEAVTGKIDLSNKAGRFDD